MNKQDIYKKYGPPIGEGRNRIVWKLTGNFVIKVPKNTDGECDNFNEYHVRNHAEHATTKLYSIDDTTIAISEYLEPLDYDEALSLSNNNEYQWFKSIDGMQVGRSKNGDIKAYDYGV